MTAILDTSGMFAALDMDARHHAACRSAMVDTPGPLLVSPMVLAELDHMVDRRGQSEVMTGTVIADIGAGVYARRHHSGRSH